MTIVLPRVRIGVSTKENIPRTFHHKILRTGQLLVASLTVALAIACGSKLPVAMFAPQTSKAAVDSQLSVAAVDSQPSRPMVAPPPSRKAVGALTAGAIGEDAAVTTPETCKGTGNILPSGNATTPTDLQINGVNCIVDGSGNAGGVTGSYVYRNVNIWNGGSLTFNDKQIDFHAHSILVEAGGTLQAGSVNPIKVPLTIWLWGAQNDGISDITCLSDNKNQCGVSDADWNPNFSMAKMKMPTGSCTPAVNLPLPNQPDSTIKDCFYQYESGTSPGTYFGSKVLAVSALGSLVLRGNKGIRTGPGPEPIETKPADSGTSWGRLTRTLNGGETSLTIDRKVPTWGAGDHIVLTTTDYLPSHSEELVIKNVTSDQYGTKIEIDTSAPAPMNAVQFPHSGDAYDYSAVVAERPGTGPAPDLNVTNLPKEHIETRAIVALLTRSIVIASEGATPTFTRGVDHFPVSPGNYYGGATMARQGFTQFQVQGVEFYQLGQGGIIGRYPVHFHMDRSVPQPKGSFLGTYVADSSIVDSMTRFITVHGTQGVTLARNVGYKSIGHGFYLEDATEVNNRLYSNVGISVRGAIADTATNPRMVPGILDLPVAQIKALPLSPKTPFYAGQPADVNGQVPDLPYVSDVTSPSVFWIMNSWNDFEYNAAVGAGTCGACYWMVPGGYSYQGVQDAKLVGVPQGGPSKYETWTSYAGMEKQGLMSSFLGGAPLMTFKGNSCSAAMNSISTTGQTSQCNGVFFGSGTSVSDDQHLYSVPNPTSVTYDGYPAENQQRAKSTVCNSANPPRPSGSTDCSTAIPCSGDNGQEASCAATVIDHYTTSFNWAQTNVGAIWLRGWWYLLDNSAITDVQNGGLTFISGGGYTRSDAAQGFWSVLKNSVLVGNTQTIESNGVPANPSASNAGPFNPSNSLKNTCNGSYCVSPQDGITFQLSNFAVNQRLFNIYDGPASQYNNIYADVNPTELGTLAQCRGAGGNKTAGNCTQQNWGNGYQVGVTLSPPRTSGNAMNRIDEKCVLPNAAIGWKQPNGFYYPPAFHSDNLVFKNVAIRHFVIQPLKDPFDANGDNTAITNTYCSWSPGMFATSFTDIDRLTELTDNDGTLTGLTSYDKDAMTPAGPTISVTHDPFFVAPLVADECASGQLPPTAPTERTSAESTASTSPYEYLTTAIVARCAIDNTCGPAPVPGLKPADQPPYWGTNCSTPACYGVPLYRQTLTSQEMTGNLRPSLKMMGQASAQRSALTLNHAQYYIDTSVPWNSQWQSGPKAYPVMFLNAFQAGKVYDVFFVYGRNSTRQTYSLYIGSGLSDDDAKAAFVPVRVMIPGNGFPMTEDPSGGWATFGGYNKTTGILTVNVNLNGLTDLEPQNREGFCQPTTYCAWKPSTNSCGCAEKSGCTDDKVCSYATAEIDCPTNGCYGFNIKMPGNFVAEQQPQPMRLLFENADSYFKAKTVTFDNAKDSAAGSCYYPVPPAQEEPKGERPRL